MTTSLPAPTTEIPCTEGACLHADPTRPCTCSTCHGTGHGHTVITEQELGRAKYTIRTTGQGGTLAALATAGGLYVPDEEW